MVYSMCVGHRISLIYNNKVEKVLLIYQSVVLYPIFIHKYIPSVFLKQFFAR